VNALAQANINPEEVARHSEGVGVEGVIKQLYDRYETPEGQDDDLSAGRLGGSFRFIKSLIGKDAAVKNYNSLKGGTLASIRSFVGEKGIMTEPDAQRIEDLLPKTTDTDEEAKLAWQNINEIFKAKYGYDVLPTDLIGGEEQVIEFDEEAARAEGYSEQEIADEKARLQGGN
jgi:hypothetical protein